MLRRGQGQASLGSASYCINNMASGGYFRSPFSMCQWYYQNRYSFSTGTSTGTNVGLPCSNSFECRVDFTACMNIDGDSYSKCTTLPIYGYLANYYGFYTKPSYGQQCSLYLKCNEFKNLKCTNYYANFTSGALPYGTCTCYGKYQYWNATSATAYGWGMCINGKRFLS